MNRYNLFLYATIFGASLVDFFLQLEAPDLVMIAGYHIKHSDAISVVFISCIFLLLRMRKLNNFSENIPFLLMVYSIIIFIISSYLYGKSSGLHFRKDLFFYSFTTLLTFIPFRPTIGVFAKAISIMIFFALILYFGREFNLIGRVRFTLEGFIDGYSSIRNVNPGHAFNFTIMGLMLWVLAIKERRTNMQFAFITGAAIFIVMVLFSLFRTTWIVLILGSSVIVYYIIRYNIRAYLPNILLSVWSIIIVFIALIASKNFYLLEAFLGMFKEGNGLSWRFEGWVGLLEKMSFFNLIFGSGYGADMMRYVQGFYIEFSAHSVYVHIFFFTGAIGLGLFLKMYLWIVRSLTNIQRRGSREDIFICILLKTSIICSVIFYITGGLALLHGFIIAFSIRFIRDKRHSSSAELIAIPKKLDSLGPVRLV